MIKIEVVMKKFVEGDNLTLDDVKQAIHESETAGKLTVNENVGVKPIFKNGVAIFDSIEDAERYYGGKIMPLEEAFR